MHSLKTVDLVLEKGKLTLVEYPLVMDLPPDIPFSKDVLQRVLIYIYQSRILVPTCLYEHDQVRLLIKPQWRDDEQRMAHYLVTRAQGPETSLYRLFTKRGDCPHIVQLQ